MYCKAYVVIPISKHIMKGAIFSKCELQSIYIYIYNDNDTLYKVLFSNYVLKSIYIVCASLFTAEEERDDRSV